MILPHCSKDTVKSLENKVVDNEEHQSLVLPLLYPISFGALHNGYNNNNKLEKKYDK